MKLEHLLERTIIVPVELATAWAFLGDDAIFASWWPKNTKAEITDRIDRGRVTFNYGYEGPGMPIAPGGSSVQLSMRPVAEGTVIEVRHHFADAKVRDLHVPGWRYQLAVLANKLTALQHANVVEKIDAWYAAWNETDAVKRALLLEKAVIDKVEFRDPHGFADGRSEVAEHIGAVHIHMPNMHVTREGEPKRTQSVAISRWSARPQDSAIAVLSGTNVYDLAPDGRIARISGIWDQA